MHYFTKNPWFLGLGEKQMNNAKHEFFITKYWFFVKNRKKSFVSSLTERCSCIIKRYTSFYTFPIWDRDTFLKKHTGWFGISGLQMHIAWMSIDKKSISSLNMQFQHHHEIINVVQKYLLLCTKKKNVICEWCTFFCKCDFLL